MKTKYILVTAIWVTIAFTLGSFCSCTPEPPIPPAPPIPPTPSQSKSQAASQGTSVTPASTADVPVGERQPQPLGFPSKADKQDEIALSFLGIGINAFEYNYPFPSKKERIATTTDCRIFPINRTSQTELYGSTFAEFAEQAASNLGLEASYNNIRATFTTEKGSGKLNNQRRHVMQIQNTTTIKNIVLSDDSLQLMQHLTPEFKKAINTMSPQKLFKLYGTHIMREVAIGGEVALKFESADTTNISKESFQKEARLIFKAAGSDFSTTTAATTFSVSQGVVRGGSPEAGNMLSNERTVENWHRWAKSLPEYPQLLTPDKGSFIPIWELTEDTSKRNELRDAYLLEVARNPRVVIFEAPGLPASKSEAQVSIPKHYKLLSGGARIDWTGCGHLLTASFPENEQTWRALGKDHKYPSPAAITVFAVTLYDPENIWETKVFSNTWGKDHLPTAKVEVPPEYVMVGGGAKVNYDGSGNMLTESYPVTENTWAAASKDQGWADPATVTVYAVGLKSKLPNFSRPRTEITKSDSPSLAFPTATISSGKGIMTGGGAKVNPSRWGSFMTASYPKNEHTWNASSKEHIWESPAVITTYRLGLIID